MTLQEMLAAAMTARHQLLLGQSFVECDYGGAGAMQKTIFKAADFDRLEAYIAEIEAKIAGKPTRGAMGIVF